MSATNFKIQIDTCNVCYMSYNRMLSNWEKISQYKYLNNVCWMIIYYSSYLRYMPNIRVYYTLYFKYVQQIWKYICIHTFKLCYISYNLENCFESTSKASFSNFVIHILSPSLLPFFDTACQIHWHICI